jgi:hypothetical protein
VDEHRDDEVPGPRVGHAEDERDDEDECDGDERSTGRPDDGDGVDAGEDDTRAHDGDGGTERLAEAALDGPPERQFFCGSDGDDGDDGQPEEHPRGVSPTTPTLLGTASMPKVVSAKLATRTNVSAPSVVPATQPRSYPEGSATPTRPGR